MTAASEGALPLQAPAPAARGLWRPLPGAGHHGRQPSAPPVGARIRRATESERPVLVDARIMGSGTSAAASGPYARLQQGLPGWQLVAAGTVDEKSHAHAEERRGEAGPAGARPFTRDRFVGGLGDAIGTTAEERREHRG